jgi:hypothetical protein
MKSDVTNGNILLMLRRGRKYTGPRTKDLLQRIATEDELHDDVNRYQRDYNHVVA